MSGEFYGGLPDAWDTAAEYLPKPWREEWAVNDLRWWLDRGADLPIVRDLRKRWGWGWYKVQALVYHPERWSDASHREQATDAVNRAKVRAPHPTGQRPDRDRTETGQPETVQSQESEANRTETGQRPDRDRTAREPLSTRSTDHLKQPPVVPLGDVPVKTTPSALWERLRAISGKVMSLTPSRKALLASAVKVVGEEGVVLIAEWAKDGADDKAIHNRKGGYDNPDTYLRPSHLGEYLDRAREWHDSGRRGGLQLTEAQRQSWRELGWLDDEHEPLEEVM